MSKLQYLGPQSIILFILQHSLWVSKISVNAKKSNDLRLKQSKRIKKCWSMFPISHSYSLWHTLTILVYITCRRINRHFNYLKLSHAIRSWQDRLFATVVRVYNPLQPYQNVTRLTFQRNPLRIIIRHYPYNWELEFGKASVLGCKLLTSFITERCISELDVQTLLTSSWQEC